MYDTGRLIRQLAIFLFYLVVNEYSKTFIVCLRTDSTWRLVKRFVCMHLALLCVRVFCLSLSMLQAVNLCVL
jgi:hypothetical protein